MDLYINNEKTVFELENEKNIFEVIIGLSEILSGLDPKQFITKISVDDKEYSLADEEKLKDIGLDKVGKTEVETSDIYGITLISIEQIKNFLQLLEEVLINSGESEINKTLDEYVDWMKKGVGQIVNLFFKEENRPVDEKEFYEKCDKLTSFVKDFQNSDFRKNALAVIQELKGHLNNIKNTLIGSFKLPDQEYIFKSLKSLVKNIDEIIPDLEKITAMFQSGNDKEAMKTVKGITEILEKSINLFVLFKDSFKLNMDEYVIKESTFEIFFKSITGHLRQLMEAIENKDSVMIGDLLEYEFIPNFGEIKSILLKIEEQAFTKLN